MHSVEQKIVKDNLSYEQSIKALDNAWNSAKSKSEKLELIKIYCDISGSKPSDIYNYLNEKGEYINISGKEYKVFIPPTVSEQLEYFDKRIENNKKNIKNIIKQRNSVYESKKYYGDKIDINQAKIEDLLRIKGVGEVKARIILETRDRIGKFESIEDIEKIEGIGSKTYKHLEQFIKV